MQITTKTLHFKIFLCTSFISCAHCTCAAKQMKLSQMANWQKIANGIFALSFDDLFTIFDSNYFCCHSRQFV